MATTRIGELLVQHGVITRAQLKKGLQTQRIYGGKLGTNLVELGFLSDTELAGFLSKQLQMPCAVPADFEHIPQQVLSLVPADFAAQHKLVPLSLEHNRLRVAISDPGDIKAIDELKFKVGKAIQAVIAPEIWVVAALERFYQVAREVRYLPSSALDENFVGEIITTSEQLMEVNRIEPDDDLDLEAAAPLGPFSDKILAAASPEEVFQILFRFLSPFFPRMAVYVVRREEICGWLLCGFPVRNSEFVKVRLPLKSENVIRGVVERQEAYRGDLRPTQEHQVLFGLLAIPAGKAVGAYPIPFREKIIGVLLGVPEKNYGPPVPEAGKIVPEAVNRAGMALEALYLKRKIAHNPTQ